MTFRRNLTEFKENLRKSLGTVRGNLREIYEILRKSLGDPEGKSNRNPGNFDEILKGPLGQI